MPETKARFLADTQKADTTAEAFTMPTGRATSNNHVLAMDNISTGTTTWQATATAPDVTDISGALNHDQDSTLTLFGSDFKETTKVSLWNASSGGSKVGSDATITNQTATRLEATFGHGSLSAGDTLYVEADNSGITTRFATAFVVSADPTITSITGATGIPSGQTSSTHLGTYGGRVAGGPQDSNTKLLLNFDRTGGTDIEDSSNTSGDGHKVTATNAVIKASPFGDGKTAMYFDGVDDRLEIDNSTDFDIGNGNFTVEFWLYDIGIADSDGLFTNQTTGGLSGWNIRRSSSELNFNQWGSSSVEVNFSSSGAGIGSSNTWRHIAFVKNGTDLKFYIDGKENGSDTVTSGTNLTASSEKLRIGDSYDGSNHSNMYMDEIRIVKGTAVYTGDFTVPTSRLTAIDNTKLLIHSDQSDHLFWERNPTISGAVQSVTNARSDWGGSSWEFDGSDDRIHIPDSPDWDLAGADFTIEWWMYVDSIAADWSRIFSTSATDSSGIMASMQTNGNLGVVMGSGSDWVQNVQAGSGTISTGEWHHVAVTYDHSATTSTVYVDGVSQGSDTSGTPTNNNVDRLCIGHWMVSGVGSAKYFDGKIEDFRVVKGKVVYTGVFSRPEGPLTTTGGTYPNSNNRTDPTGSETVFLLHGDGAKFTDSSPTTGGRSVHNITRTGSFHSQAHGGIAPAMTFPTSLKKTGSAGVYLDGTADYLSVPDHADLQWGSDSFSIDFWMYLSSLPSGSSGNNGYMIMFNGNDAGDTVNWELQLDASVGLMMSGSGGFLGANEGNMNDWQSFRWYHIAISRNGTSTFKVYRDGVRIISQTSGLSASSASSYGIKIGGYSTTVNNNYNTTGFHGYLDSIRIQKGVIAFTGDNTSSANFTLPTHIYGAFLDRTIPTITFTGQLASGALASDEDIEFSNVANTSNPSGMQKLDDSKIGLALTNLTGSDKNKATLTGTISDNFSGTSRTGIPVKAQVRTERGNAAYDSTGSSKRLVTFSSSTNTEGLQPGYTVTGVGSSNGIQDGTTIASIDSATTLTLSQDTNGGALTGKTLHFGDPERQIHVNGSEVLSNSDAMLTIAVDPESQPVLFNARRYIGTSAVRDINGFGFQPDLVWFKTRSQSYHHALFDSVRGTARFLESDRNVAENTANTNTLTAFNADGFESGADSTWYLNKADEKYIAWAWKAGGAPSGELAGDGATASLTNGFGNGTIHQNATGVSDVTSITQSVNQNSGFSITQYTGGGGDTASFPHNLGGTPDFIIIKNLEEARSWVVWHKDLTNASNSDNNVYNLWLDLSAQQYNATSGQHDHGAIAGPTGSGSSAVINVRKSGDSAIGGVNQSTKKYICYAWKAVPGVSKFGVYTGNGSSISDSKVVDDVGFVPKFLIIKGINSAGNWHLVTSNIHGADTTTTGSDYMPDGNSKSLAANSPNSEASWHSNKVETYIDSSNSANKGFKVLTNDWEWNNDGEKYIYMAFA